MNKTKAEELKSFIMRWNINFPVDRWWRNKHKVAFNSSEHREVSFLDQYYEYLEDKMYTDISKKHEKNNLYKPNTNNFIDIPDQENISIDEFKQEAKDALLKFQDFKMIDL